MQHVRAHRRFRVMAGVASVVALVGSVTATLAVGSSASTAGAAVAVRSRWVVAAAEGSSPKVTVTPSSGLHSGQVVRVSVTDEPAGATLLALQCSTQAVSIGEDGCENRQNSVFFGSGTTRTSATTLRVTPDMETATGSVSCTKSECLVAVVRLTNGNSTSILGAIAISFAAKPGAVGSNPAGPGTDVGPPPPPAWSSPPGVPAGTLVTATKSDSMHLRANPAGDLTSPGAITGPGTALPTDPPGSETASGPGLLQLVLAAPGTSWASAAHTAVVARVKVGNGAWQEVVCFAGSRPFTYAAVFGTLVTGSRPKVTVAVSRSLSTTGSLVPTLRVIAIRLSVVTPSNPDYLEMAYAPIFYGRPDTASSDTPLLTFASESPAGSGPKGTEQLGYTTIWTKEDAGTSFVPWLEWGEWGRMTDITETIQLEVTPSGKILHPMYDSCGCSANYPVNRTSPIEEEVPFKGKRSGDHLIVRNASGNDYQVDTGTSAFLMEQAPVAGPSEGAVRESVMNANPWTYRISADELSRWYGDGSTNPSSPEIGDSRQYAIVDVDTDAVGTSAVAVAIKLKGSSQWYRNDFGSGYALYDGGHGRTAVKLPLDWASKGIAAVHLVAYPDASHWSVTDGAVEISSLGSAYGLSEVAVPPPVVTKG